MNEISRYVNDKITDDTYQKLSTLKEIDFKYSRMVYFSKDNIDDGQKGYRYIPDSDEIINEWPDDNLVIIGLDPSPDPILLKVDEDNLPVYIFENSDWNYPEVIADSLDDYIKINNMIAEYSESIENKSLNETEFTELIEKIKVINDNRYWTQLLLMGCPSDEPWVEKWSYI